MKGTFLLQRRQESAPDGAARRGQVLRLFYFKEGYLSLFSNKKGWVSLV